MIQERGERIMEKQESPNTKTQLTEKQADQVAGGRGEDYCTCEIPSYKDASLVCSKCGKKRSPRVHINTR